jgi:transcriptional regulator of NAD metabolism
LPQQARRIASDGGTGGRLMQERQKIGEILVQLKVLTRSDVDRVLEALRRRQRRQKFGQTARDMGLIDEEHILAALAVQMNLVPGGRRQTLNQILEYLQSAEAAV